MPGKKEGLGAWSGAPEPPGHVHGHADPHPTCPSGGEQAGEFTRCLPQTLPLFGSLLGCQGDWLRWAELIISPFP